MDKELDCCENCGFAEDDWLFAHCGKAGFLLDKSKEECDYSKERDPRCPLKKEAQNGTSSD